MGRRPLILIDACLVGQEVELLIVVVEPLREVEPAIQGERSGEPGRVEPFGLQDLRQHLVLWIHHEAVPRGAVVMRIRAGEE